MAQRNQKSDGRSSRDLFAVSNKSTTMSASAKPKSSTSAAGKTQTKEPIKSYIEIEDDDEDEEDQLSRPKVPTTKRQFIQEQDSDDETDDDDDESRDESEKDDDEPSFAITKKQTSKRSHQSEDDDSDTPKPISKKPKSSASSEPVPKSQTSQVPPSNKENLDSEEDSSDEEDDAQPITMVEYKGDLFTAPNKTLLLHACNCQGSWDKGIAWEFQKNYPDHYSRYAAHCRDHDAQHIVGTCLLIKPQEHGREHWVGCLFTSRRYGKYKDKKDKILQNTENALDSLVEQLEDMDVAERPKAVWMCKINSGMFRVPWPETEAILAKLEVRGGLHITIMDKK